MIIISNSSRTIIYHLDLHLRHSITHDTSTCNKIETNMQLPATPAYLPTIPSNRSTQTSGEASDQIHVTTWELRGVFGLTRKTESHRFPIRLLWYHMKTTWKVNLIWGYILYVYITNITCVSAHTPSMETKNDWYLNHQNYIFNIIQPSTFPSNIGLAVEALSLGTVQRPKTKVLIRLFSWSSAGCWSPSPLKMNGWNLKIANREKEKHLPSTSMSLGFKMLIFQGQVMIQTI